MEAQKVFDSPDESLSDLLRELQKGEVQLPDFQRGWVWDDEHIRSLLASISLSYPIGAVMMLQTGGKGVRFKPRPIEGAKTDKDDPSRLILDGQQRLTSLFLSLFMNEPVLTRDSRGHAVKRWYYLDISKALDPEADREEAIRSIPEDKVVKNFRGEVIEDYSTIEKECASELLPLSAVFSMTELNKWQESYLQMAPERFMERLARWNDLFQEVLIRFQQYLLPVIVLTKEVPKEAVCQVFEKVNTGGVTLTVFELLTATFAADDFHLRDDWETRKKELKPYRVLEGIQSDDILQSITLLSTYDRKLKALCGGIEPEKAPGISCKRKDILKLSLEEYQKWADLVIKGYIRAARFLLTQKIFIYRDLPYRTQLVPLAAMLALLENKADDYGVQKKIAKWYWCGVLGELYGATVESRFAKDLPQMLEWISGGHEPDTIVDATFNQTRLQSLRTRNSAAYKGIYAVLMRDGGLDFIKGDGIEMATYFEDRIDIHHVFPQAWCKKHGIDPKRCDSIVNKAAISARTNKIISGDAPSSYLPKIQKKANISDQDMDRILESHLINPDMLRRDDFDSFFKTREKELLSRIENAMGKPAMYDVVEPEIQEPVEYEDEEQAD